MPAISEGRAQALRQAVWDACAEAFSEEEPAADGRSKNPKDPRQLILGVVYPVLKKFTRERNARRSATTQLPHELLCAIFLLLPFQDRIACTHVCHHWRDISLANPAKLWNFIPGDDRPDVIWDLLDRASDAPVTLERIKITSDRNASMIGDMLCSHMDHIKSLLLELPSNRDEYEGTPDTIHDALQLRAPLLERFVVIDKYMDGFDLCEEFWSNMFASDAPRLREIKLFGLSYDVLPTTFTSTSVRKLYLGSNGSVLKLDRILEAFSLFPQLEELGLEISTAFERDRAFPNTAAPLDPPRTLRRLVVYFTSVSAIMTHALSYIRHVDIAEVEVTFWDAGDWAYTIATGQMLGQLYGPVQDVVSLEIGKARRGESYYSEIPFVCLTDHHGRSRRVRSVPFEATQAGAYTRLVMLTLHISQLAEHAGRRIFTALPVLAELSIMCAESSDDHCIHTILEETRNYWPLHCPLLSKVALCTPAPRTGWLRDGDDTVDAAEVTQLLRSCLRFDAEKVALLTFCSMGVESATGDPIVVLRTFAQDVLLDQPAPDPVWVRQPPLDWT
ncbi:hypothetical protein AURDEDRAFT_184011 [Auricularia subglabra TFB-10046 SS5]|nr:hypothetical protein AURDEDRAFT_184011 [Auricularia subglabra TFB-10046 SS5]